MRKLRLMRTMTAAEQGLYLQLLEQHGGKALNERQVEYIGHCVKAKREPSPIQLRNLRTPEKETVR